MIATLPRPVLLGVVGVLLIGAVFVTTHKRGGTTSTPSTPAPAQTAPAATPSSTKQAPPTAAKPASRPTGKGLPVPVQKALDAKKVVVVLFWNPRGIDDRSVKGSVDRLQHRGGKLAVFSDSVKHLSRYTRITAATNVSQTPTLVVVNRKGQAELQTGYLDYQTISQYVQNALRR